jgi:hypothetical protein
MQEPHYASCHYWNDRIFYNGEVVFLAGSISYNRLNLLLTLDRKNMSLFPGNAWLQVQL